MRKVLFVATVVRLHINMFHKPFLKWFHDQGWQVHVAANNDYANPDDCVIPYCDRFHCLPIERNPWRRGNLDAYQQLKKLLDEEQYDLIHCHTPMGGALARLAASSARNKGTKVIYTAHGFHFFKGARLINWLAYYPVERMLSRKTDLLVTINQEDHTRAKGFHAGRTEIVNGVGLDLDRFRVATAEEKAAVRRELGLKEGDTFGISVSRLTREKGCMVLIEAVHKLADPNFHMFILGDGAEEAEMRSRIHQLGLEDRIHLLGFRADVDRLCPAADLFVFSSLREGLPVALMEAMACGVPIVASDIRGNRDLIDSDRGGWLVPAGDAEGLAKGIVHALESRSEWDKIRDYNLEKIQHYSTEAVVAQLGEIYQSLM